MAEAVKWWRANRAEPDLLTSEIARAFKLIRSQPRIGALARNAPCRAFVAFTLVEFAITSTTGSLRHPKLWKFSHSGTAAEEPVQAFEGG